MIYLDHNATSPPHPEVLRLALPLITQDWGNTGSSHSMGRAPHAAVEQARAKVAQWAGARPKDVVLAGGATEANNMAILGVPGPVVCSATEHPSVMEAVRQAGGQVVAVDNAGRLQLDALERALGAQEVALVSVLAANNETGVMQDIPAIHAITQRHGVPLHLDCAQLIGRHPAPERWEMITVTGHKAGGLKGAGALILRPGRELLPQSFGGGQERGRRAGTLNPAPIAGLGVVATLSHSPALRAQRDRLEAAALSLGGVVTGGAAPRLWNTCNVVFQGIPSDMLVAGMDLQGVCCSAGSACASGAAQASSALQAMGIEHSALRLSLGWSTTDQDISTAIQVLERVLTRLRGVL